MTTPTGPGFLPTRETAEGGPLTQDDVVALVCGVPQLDLPEGTWGTILATFEDGTCEVEFTDREGEPILTARVPAEALELLWSEA